MKVKHLLAIAMFLIAITTVSADLTDGLISYYSFDVDARDDWGDNEGIPKNDISLNNSGLIGNTYEWDGLDDYIFIDTINEPIKSLSIWVYFTESFKPNNIDYLGPIFGFDDTLNLPNLWIGENTQMINESFLYLEDIQHITYISDYEFFKGWHNIVLVWNESDLRYDFYIDNTDFQELFDRLGHGRLLENVPVLVGGRLQYGGSFFPES